MEFATKPLTNILLSLRQPTDKVRGSIKGASMLHTQGYILPAAYKPMPSALFTLPSSRIKLKHSRGIFCSKKIFAWFPFHNFQPKQTKTICTKLLLVLGLLSFVLFQTASGTACAQSAAASSFGVESIPNPRLQSNSQYVSNPDGIITAADEAEINRLASALERDLGVQVAVAALGDIGNKEYRMFATELFNYWGVGQKGEDNGLLILLVLDPAQRSVTFETGYGLEGVMPDAICYRIQQDYMIPALKNGNYSQGMREGMAAVDRYLRDSGYKSSIQRQPETAHSDSSDYDYTEDIVVTLIMVVLPICFMLFMIWRHLRPRICPSCGQRGYKRYEAQIISQPSFHHPGLAIDTWRCVRCGYVHKIERRIPKRRRVQTGSGRSGRGGFGGGGFGGRSGGGGFGGGRSGGGGASSRF